MQYLITFLEGIITFISPCLLPMLPLYVVYFTGGGEQKRGRAFVNSLGFVLGFTIFFVTLGAFAGAVGGFLTKYKTALNIVSGVIVALFGLGFTGLFCLPSFGGAAQTKVRPNTFAKSALFGLIFSVGWTPCVGAFLGSALALAAQRSSAAEGVLLLVCYSLGLGIPFVLAAVLLDKLKGAFDFIKKHYSVINIVCGSLLVILGVLMACGVMDKLFRSII